LTRAHGKVRYAALLFPRKDSTEFIDRDGVELAGLEKARAQAVTAAAEALRDLDGRFWSGEDWHMWVTDESGATVCRLRFCGEFSGAPPRSRSLRKARRPPPWRKKGRTEVRPKSREETPKMGSGIATPITTPRKELTLHRTRVATPYQEWLRVNESQPAQRF
jgi:hypothetical protein